MESEGGFERVGKDRKWFQVVQKLGLPPVKSLSTVLRNHYERLLLPYDIFKQTGGFVAQDDGKNELKVEVIVDTDYVPHDIVQRQNIPPPNSVIQRRSKRHCEPAVNDENQEEDVRDNKELKRLAFYGAGPKLPGYSPPKKKGKTDKSNTNQNDSAVAHIICKVGFSRRQLFLS